MGITATPGEFLGNVGVHRKTAFWSTTLHTIPVGPFLDNGRYTMEKGFSKGTAVVEKESAEFKQRLKAVRKAKKNCKGLL